MRLRNKLVGAVSPEDIAALLENEVGESRILDYKRDLPGSSSGEKKEFLADVSALANTTGGVIVYGIAEGKGTDGQNTGIPESVSGIKGLNSGSEELRLTSMLLDGITPSIGSGVRFQDVLGPEGEKVLILGIPQSFAGPHMVSFEKANKFWRRSESGKYSPDIAELRSMFNQQQSWREQAEHFRETRLDLITGLKATPVEQTGTVFVHILPLGRLGEVRELKGLQNEMVTHAAPLSSSGFNWRFNSDGFMTYSSDSGGWVSSYTQWFRFGGIEGHSARFVREAGSTRFFHVRELTNSLDFYVPDAVKALRELFDHSPPYVLMISLVGLKNTVITANSLGEPHPIDQNRISLPPVTLDSDDPEELKSSLGLLKDMLWQCGGFEGAPRR